MKAKGRPRRSGQLTDGSNLVMAWLVCVFTVRDLQTSATQTPGAGQPNGIASSERSNQLPSTICRGIVHQRHKQRLEKMRPATASGWLVD